MTPLRPRILLPALAGLLLAACSLARNDPPPPEAFGTSGTPAPLAASGSVNPAPAAAGAQPTGAVPVALLPESRPSAADGSIVYAQHCAPCHGDTGNADGSMVANLPSGAVVPKFSQPDLARQASPQAWYQVVTGGRMDKLMPPFQDKLSDAERWNAVAFLYALSTTPDQLSAGNQVYIANCARCHGEDGRGRGPEAANLQLRDFTDPQRAAAVSPADLFAAISGGAAGHQFQSQLSEADRWNVAAFVRAFAYDYYAPGSPLPVKTGRVRGQVANGTAGGALSGPVDVNLLGFNDSGVTQSLTGTTDAQGKFEFAGVTYQSGEQFVVAATYQGIAYHSAALAFASGQDQLDAAVKVFEVTDQPAGLRISRLHTFVLFEVPGFVTLGQLYLISNTGDRTFQPANGRTVEFTLPAGATDLQVQDGTEGTTYFRTEAGLVDTVPVIPGEASSQVLFSFKLPYSDSLAFSQPMPYPVDAVNVMIGDSAVSLSGGDFSAGAAQDFSGQTFVNYNRAGLEAGTPLTFDLRGAAGSGQASAASAPTAAAAAANPGEIGLGLGVLAAALLGVGGYWWLRAGRAGRPGRGSAPSEREDLLQAIAELDDERAAGKVGEAEYQTERAWLMQELRKVWPAG